MNNININNFCKNKDKYSKYKQNQIKKISKKISKNMPIDNKRYKKTWIDFICNNSKSKKQKNIIDCSITSHNGFSSKNNKNKINKLCIYEDNKIDFSKCKYKTLIANNNVKLENLHKENMSKNGKSRIIQLWDNSCFDINELVYFIVGNSGENRNPFNNNKIWQDIDELNSIKSHPKLTKELKDKLEELFPNYSDREIANNGLKINPEILYIIGEVAIILLSDYKDEYFEDSNKALVYLANSINKLNDEQKNIFFSLTTPSGISLSKTIEDAPQNCIHNAGFKIASIYCKYWLLYLQYSQNKINDIIHPAYHLFNYNNSNRAIFFTYWCKIRKDKLQGLIYSEKDTISDILVARLLSIDIKNNEIHSVEVGDIWGSYYSIANKWSTFIYESKYYLENLIEYMLKKREPTGEIYKSLIKDSFNDFKVKQKNIFNNLELGDYIIFKAKDSKLKYGIFIKFKKDISANENEAIWLKYINDNGKIEYKIVYFKDILNVFTGYNGLLINELIYLYSSNIINNNTNNSFLKLSNNTLPERNMHFYFDNLKKKYKETNIIEDNDVSYIMDIINNEIKLITKNYNIIQKELEIIKDDSIVDIFLKKLDNSFKILREFVIKINKNELFKIYELFYQTEKENFNQYLKDMIKLLNTVREQVFNFSPRIDSLSMHNILPSKLFDKPFAIDFYQNLNIPEIINAYSQFNPKQENTKIIKILERFSSIDNEIEDYRKNLYSTYVIKFFKKVEEYLNIISLLQDTNYYLNYIKYVKSTKSENDSNKINKKLIERIKLIDEQLGNANKNKDFELLSKNELLKKLDYYEIQYNGHTFQEKNIESRIKHLEFELGLTRNDNKNKNFGQPGEVNDIPPKNNKLILKNIQDKVKNNQNMPKITKLETKFIKYNPKNENQVLKFFSISTTDTIIKWLNALTSTDLLNKNKTYDRHFVLHNEYFANFPPLVYDTDKNKLYFNNDVTIDTLKKYIISTQKDYILILLEVDDDSNQLIIIDKVYKTLIRFDPMGIMNNVSLDKNINILIESELNVFTYIKPDDYHISDELTNLMKSYNFPNNTISVILILFYTHMFLWNNRIRKNGIIVNHTFIDIYNNIAQLNLINQVIPNIKGYMIYIKNYLEKNDIQFELVNQLNSNNVLFKNNKKLVLVLHSTYDPNQAFNNNGDEGLFNIFKKMKTIDFKYEKISNVWDVINILTNIKQEITHLIIMGHGEKNRIIIGKNINSKIYSLTSTITNSTDYDLSVNDFAKLLKPKLHKQATILLHSCCVGEGGPTKINLASKLAHYLPGHCIFGSDKPISRGDLILTLAEEDIQKGILNIDYLIDPKRDYEIYKFINNSKNHHKGGNNYRKNLLKFII